MINVIKEKGSTGSIVSSIFGEIKRRGEEAYFLYGRGKKSNCTKMYRPTIQIESKFHHFISLFSGNLYGGMYISTLRIIHTIKKINPDVIHLHCLNGYFVNVYLLLKWLKRTQYKLIFTIHADFMLTGNCGIAGDCEQWKANSCKCCKHVDSFNGKHSLNRTYFFYNKMYKAFSEFNKNQLTITGVSPWLSYRIKESPIYRNYKVVTTLNPVDNFFFEKTNVLKNETQILFVTPDFYDPLKGGQFLIKIANMLPNYNFVLVDAKEQEIAVPNNVKIVFHPPKLLLKELYQSSKCTLILSKRETFSMVSAESIVSGTPVIGFENGGTNSWLKTPFFAEYGDTDKIVDWIKSGKLEYDSSIANVLKTVNCVNRLFELYLERN